MNRRPLACLTTSFSTTSVAVEEAGGGQPFPPGQLDRHGEQVDLRARNSWTYSLGEVPLAELLQVLAVKAGLKPLLLLIRKM